MPVNLFDLNPPQRQAAETIEGPLLVFAGAGTGKTRVITYRMAHMIEQGIEPRHILAVTFTNKAAAEMKERFLKLANARNNPKARNLVASTIHSFCAGVLRKHIEHLGYKRNFTIYDAGDQLSLVKKIINEINGSQSGENNLNPQRIIALISKAKNKNIPIEEISEGDLIIQRIFAKYQKSLKLHNAVDFDDLLLLTFKLLRDIPEVKETLRDRHRYLLIDEFQDTNPLQFDILRRLATPRNNICVVGDDDQSIYSWRGAESNHILQFPEQFPGCKVVKLEQNYRSTPAILKAANAVIQNNARRHAKALWTDVPPGENIRLADAENQNAEAEWVLNDLYQARQERGLKWEDFAILYRTNQLSRIFEQELRRFQIPYRIVGGLSFFERREVKDILAYLQAIRNPDDDISLLRIINSPPRGIGDTTVEHLINQSRHTDRSVWAEITRPTADIKPRSRQALENFVQLIRHYQAQFRSSARASDLLKKLIQDIGYFEELTRTSKNGEEAMQRSENVRELVNALVSFEEDPESGGLERFLDTSAMDKNRMSKKEDKNWGVTLMTLHAAKGLEFRHVYLVGIEEGILPHNRVKLEGEDPDEERRLFYVGITRAQKRLTLTYCLSRRKYGQEMPQFPSSFLSELPEDVIDSLDANRQNHMISHAAAVSRLSALRAKLSG